MNPKLNPVVQEKLSELDRKRKSDDWNRKYYISVSNGLIKERLYVNNKPRPRKFGKLYE